ncbi:MAG: response regulator [Candidatus Aquicultorales bacterium]
MITELRPLHEGIKRISVVVAASTPAALNGVVSALNQAEGFEVKASILDGEECLAELDRAVPDVLVTEINLPKVSGVKIAEYLSVERPEIATVILADQNSLGLFRTAMLAGAMDFLILPLPGEELTASVLRAYQLKSERRRQWEERSPGGKTDDRPAKIGKDGKAITVCGGKGGTGKSIIASLLSVYLASRTDLTAALVDFDLQFGDLAVLFDTAPRKSLLDLVPVVDELDTQLLKSACVRAEAGFDLFLAPPQVEKSELLGTDQVTKILRSLRRAYDLIINNTGPRLGEIHLDLFDASDLVLAVTTQDISSLKATAQSKGVFDKLGLNSDGFGIVVNKCDPEHPVQPQKIASSLGAPVLGTIPDLGFTALAMIEQGVLSFEGVSPSVDLAFAELAEALGRRLGFELEPLAMELSGRRKGAGWLPFSKG